MKNLSTILFVLFVFQGFGQEIKQDNRLEFADVFMSELVDRDYGEGLTQFIGEWEGGVVTLTTFKEVDKFQRYNKELKPVKSNSIAHSSMVDGKSIVTNHGFLIDKEGKNFKRLVGITSNKTKTNALYLVDFDMESLEMSNWVEVSSIDDRYFDDFHNTWVGFKYSLDSSHVLIAHKLPEKESDDFQFRVIALSGKDLSVLWSKNLALGENGGPIPRFQGKVFGNQYVGRVDPTHLNYKYLTEDMTIDNSGIVYSWAHFDLGRGIKAEERFKVKSLVITEQGMNMADVELDNNHYLPRNDFDVIPRKEGCLLVSSCLRTGDQARALVVNAANELEYVQTDNLPLNISELFTFSDGRMIIHSGISTLSYVDENLQVLWQVTIGMNQDFGSFNQVGMAGIKMYVTNNRCYAMFNDHKKNMGDLWSERELQTYYPAKGDQLVGALATIELNDAEDGIREAMWTADNLGGFYTPLWANYNAVFGNNHYHYVQGKGRSERIVKVIFR